MKFRNSAKPIRCTLALWLRRLLFLPLNMPGRIVMLSDVLLQANLWNLPQESSVGTSQKTSLLTEIQMAFENSFYFLRHGETTWNHSKTTQGQTDTPLNETGRAQAQKAAEILADEPIERIVSSPLSRVRHTAEAVAKHHDVELLFDDGLMECHLGDLQGQPHGPWLRDYWMSEFDPPNGETFGEFSNRVWEAMQRAVALGPNTLIVAHGGLWIAAHEFVKVEPALMPMPNALPVLVDPTAGIWKQTVLS